MGASLSLATDPDFISVQGDVSTLKRTVSDYSTIKSKVDNIGSAAAASLDYDNLAGKITEVDAYNRKIADKISDSPGKLGDSLNEKIANNAVFIAKIGKLLEDNTTFTNSLATTLTDTTKSFRNKIVGPKGDSGEISSSAASVKDNLYNKKYTLWCADGDICNLPAGSKGFASGEDIILTPKSNVKVVGGLEVTGNISNPGRMHIAGEEDLYILNKKGMVIGKEWGGNGDLTVQGNEGVGGNLDVGGNLKVTGNISNPGRIHVSGEEDLYILNKKGMVIGKDWGGNGNLTAAGDLSVGGVLRVGRWTIDGGNDLIITADNGRPSYKFALNNDGNFVAKTGDYSRNF